MSILFNGTTSQLTNSTANVLNSLPALTVLCHALATGQGEGSFGRLLVLEEGEGAGSASWILGHNNAANQLIVLKNAGAAGTNGLWNFPATDNAWRALAIFHDFSADGPPTARVDYAAVTVTETTPPSGAVDQPATGYCVGNRSGGDRTWAGNIAHLQVFNRILSDSEADQALRSPGLITTGLRLYLPMSIGTDVNDLSGNGFNGTATALATGTSDPKIGVSFTKASLYGDLLYHRNRAA